jgi:HEAT repeat protein
MNYRLIAAVILPLALMGAGPEDKPPTEQGKAIRLAINGLYSSDEYVRSTAMTALVKIGPAAVPSLTKTLKSTAPLARVCAAEALWLIERNTKAVLPVLLAATEHEDEQVRSAAAMAFSAIGPDGKAAAPALRKLRKDRSPGVRVDAAFAVWRVERQPEEVLPVFAQVLKEAPNDDGPLEDAFGLLSMMGKDARGITPTVLELLQGSNDFKRHKAITLLGDIGADPKVAVPALRKALKDKYYLARGNAAVALGKMGQDARVALPDLRALLKDENGLVRVQAGNAVWGLDRDAKGVVPVLIAELNNRKDFLAAISAAVALGRIGPAAKAAVPALRRMLADENEARRNAARDALRSIDPKALPEQKKP